ncbi:uncharacterized protein LOC142463726 isoform X2 [Ascaphus truei]
MGDINLIQSWSRYNAKIQTLRHTLGLPSLQKMIDQGSNPSLARYYAQVHTLHQKLGLPAYENPKQLTFHSRSSLDAADTVRKAKVSDKQYVTGRELRREVQKYYGPSAVESMMQSYSQGPLSKVVPAPPRQEMIDSVLVRRSIYRLQNQEHNADAMRKLNEEKKHLKKALKTLELQNEFFGNGKKYVLQGKIPPIVKHSADLRKDNHTADLPGTPLHITQDLEMDQHLLAEVVEEMMNGALTHAPERMDPGSAEQLHMKLKSAMCMDLSVHLIAEEIILEITLEMTEHLANDVVKRVNLTSEFDLRFDSAEVQDYLKKSNPLNF